MTGHGDLLSIWQIEVQTDKTLALTAASKTKQTIFQNKDKVDTGVYNVHFEPANTNRFLMCLYFNLGFEGRVERSKFLDDIFFETFMLTIISLLYSY